MDAQDAATRTPDPAGWGAALDAALRVSRQAWAGEPAALVVSGEPGVGKSTLLDELVRRADGFHVLASEALEGDIEPCSSLVGWGVSIDPTDLRASSSFLAAQEIRSILDRVGPDRPVLLRLDDLHWADPESVQALIALMRRLSGDRLLLAVATRPLGDTHPEWQRWADSAANVTQITLNGLSLAEATELARRRQPALDFATVRSLWEHTTGNPLYLTALLSENDPATLVGSRVLPAPEQFARLTGQRLGRLGDPPLRLLRAAVVMGVNWVSLADAAEVAELDDPDAAVGALTGAGLLQVRDLAGSEIRSSHAMLRSAVYQQIPLAERRALHGRAAEVAGQPDAVWEHRAIATTGYDDDLAQELADHGWACYEQRRFRDAAHFLRQSAGLVSDVQLRERRWLDSLYVRTMAGDFAAVRAELPRVRQALDSARRSLVLGAFEVAQSHYPLGVEILSSAPESAAVGDPDAGRVRYRIQSLLAWARTAYGVLNELVLDCVRQCTDLGITDPATTAPVTYAAGVVRLRIHGAATVLAALPDLPDNQAGMPDEQAYLIGLRGLMHMLLGHFSPAIRHQMATQARIRTGQQAEGTPGAADALLGHSYWWTGQWDLARLNFRLARRTPDVALSPFTVGFMVVDPAGRGEFTEADRLLTRLEDELTHMPWPEAVWLTLGAKVIRLHAQAGTDAERAVLLPSFRSRWRTALGSRFLQGPLMINPALAAIWANDLEQAQAWVAMVDAGPQPPSWATATATWLRALIAERRGDEPAALSLIRQAAAGDAAATPFYRAHILSDQARLEQRGGDPGRAAAAAVAATELYRKLGAITYLDHPHLQPGTPGPEDPSSPTTSSTPMIGNRYGLSDRERDVLTLLIRGLSMRQIAQELFITSSTVSFHLGRIYAKTGVHSRHQLTQLLREQTLVGGTPPGPDSGPGRRTRTATGRGDSQGTVR